MSCTYSLEKEVSMKYIQNKRTTGLFLVSVHWYALGIINHRHVFTSDYAEASAIANWYQGTYASKWHFPHAVYINEEAIYEEW